ncbi:hypothetical protein A0J61_10999 [Choanephora cucurbitarum]|uniref:Uncharacterized protein n=1 Tax=Choanephora cucurbitarum TaxID=101091 RepID=A0A1C7MVX5_9FUNG|nr:hypothetical protein A0J61_10999 [Choanephora cucurbitarum]
MTLFIGNEPSTNRIASLLGYRSSLRSFTGHSSQRQEVVKYDMLKTVAVLLAFGQTLNVYKTSFYNNRLFQSSLEFKRIHLRPEEFN